ncbi:hypothetical protein BD413DRAFT_463250 [Trametes elegans]|nr:hypothetical protein BD413DRAFT_463250 [Trametes elegans]
MSDSSGTNSFSLDISGVAGFFGGDASVSAMATVHIYEGRKWLGWYNQPGSYEIARRYGQLSRSRLWDALYPGVNVDPAVLFEFDGTEGPKFTAVHSGTVLAKTGHVAKIFMDGCKDMDIAENPHYGGRRTKAGFVTIAHLNRVPPANESPRQDRDFTSVLAGVPILASIGACVLCGIIHDWYSFACILLGIFSSGVSCYVIGTGTLAFLHPEPADGVPPGDGVLDGGDDLVVLKGAEGAVNAVTRGSFSLEYESAPKYHNIGVCAVLLTLQFLVQLLLIPQGVLHGQLAFLFSLGCSWAYNSYLSSFDRLSIQRAILLDQVLKVKEQTADLRRYELGTRTATVVFALLALANSPGAKPQTEALSKVLDDLMPNDTAEWKVWKGEVLRCIQKDFGDNPRGFQFVFNTSGAPQTKLLQNLYLDAQAAAKMYTQLT